MKKLLSILVISLLSVSAMAQKPATFAEGMIKVSVFYPNDEGTTFDMDYYTSKHLPFVGGLLGDALKGATVEKGLGGGAPNSPATFAAMGNMYFSSMEEFQNAFGPNAEKIMADLPNFCSVEPIIQISVVML
jgi:uncharacterized protein (TIGR02118 family)